MFMSKCKLEVISGIELFVTEINFVKVIKNIFDLWIYWTAFVLNHLVKLVGSLFFVLVAAGIVNCFMYLLQEHFNYYTMDAALGHLVFSVKYDVIGDQEHLRLMLRYSFYTFSLFCFLLHLQFFAVVVSP